ncbi:polysaccharide deacetylase family protein [Sporosarcina koreensis]|uniref:polysaccharide deacetylase family protein n=1 Tax=Sporosarcina koreensis TaxID=334735 RepID=UPI0009E4DF91|nr:polysaccharide deacetylase family protein [Sporosarcina koreensis]
MEKKRGIGKFSLIDVLLTAVILFLATTALVLLVTNQKSDQHLMSAKMPEPGDTNVKVDKSDSNYEGIGIITETSNDPLVKYAIQYPESGNDEFNRDVRGYIDQEKNRYLAALANVKKPKQKKSELNISFETHVDHKGNYSFVITNNETVGGVKQPADIESFHLDRESGTVMDIRNVFSDSPETVEEVTKRVRETIMHTEGLQEGIIADKMQIRTEPDWKNYKNFALTDKEIIFYFESGSLKEEAAGAQAAKLPIDKVNDLLEPAYQVAAAKPAGGDKPDTGKSAGSVDGTKKTGEAVKTEGGKPKAGGEETAPAAPQQKRVALTFDDGPEPASTGKILEILKKYDAKATFFMLGSRVEYYPDLAKAVKDAGHEIGNHSWNHPDLSKMTLPKALEEINRTKDIIHKVTGEKPTVFRPPYGAYTEQLSKQTIPPIVLWDVDTMDWKYRDAGKLLEEVKKATKDGSTVLMHDIHMSTADGLEAVMQYLTAEGYTFVTVSEMK